MSQCPPYEYITIVDAIIDIVLFTRVRHVGFPWTAKQTLFLNERVWGKTLRFNCLKWEGTFQRLQEISSAFNKCLNVDRLSVTASTPLWVLFQWAASALWMMTTHYLHTKMAGQPHDEIHKVMKEYGLGDQLVADPYRKPIEPRLLADLTGRPVRERWEPKSWDDLNQLFSVQRLASSHDRRKRLLRDKLFGTPKYSPQQEDADAEIN